MTPALVFRGVSKQFANYPVLDGIHLEASLGAFLSVVGPSGCGKSTLLNLAAGLIEASTGVIEVFGQPLTGINRRAGYVFQQEVLLPWKTVLDNVRLGPALAGLPKEQSVTLAREWIRRVGLEAFSHCYPHQLSGGMRKRVAMAQTWITKPDIVLMDEPFAALDVHTRIQMQMELLHLWSSTKNTVLFVTHDLEEAIALADEVLVLSAGPGSRIVGRYPIELERPRNLIDIKTEDAFREIYRAIWRDLRLEVQRSYERSGQTLQLAR
ncbi:MAG: ABC transporter ATP-binding protein [Bryobacteraceae bacterium]|nr:ABC transporter ATP-binding protein [Bryobacteraceae bacterium]MDW8377499.1 ABC transporter ATP-binding protein [Bryobacterales bacterium]